MDNTYLNLNKYCTLTIERAGYSRSNGKKTTLLYIIKMDSTYLN